MEDEFFEYASRGRRAEAYSLNPKAGPTLGQVIVVHEVWGFTGFIRNLCGQLSRQGFRAVAPVLYWRDKALFSPRRLREGMRAVWHLSLEERYELAKLETAIKKGGVPKETEAMLRLLYDARFRGTLFGDLLSLARRLKKDSPELKTAAMGFSMGGKLAMQLTAAADGVSCCIAYSPEPIRGTTLRKIRAPMLMFYGAEDRFMMQNLPDFVKEVIDTKKQLELKIFRSAKHEFFDSTNAREYNQLAATDAWEASVAFLRRNLAPTS